MSKIRFDIDVQDANIADQIERRIEDGISDAISTRRPQSLGHQLQRIAKEHIRRHGKIWTGELIESFDLSAKEQNGSAKLVLTNDAGHAAAIDTGATYGDEGPPLYRLIPWVESKMKGYRVEGGQLVIYDNDRGGKTILTDGSGKVQGATLDLPPDLDVEEVQRLSDIGVEGGANEANAFYISFANGEAAYFQRYIDDDIIGGSEPGTVRNEQLFTRLSSIEDWRLGPENRAGQIIDPDSGEIFDGNFQRWVDDSTDLTLEIEGPFMSEDFETEWTPPEFMNEFREDLARITIMDILLGNDDRHAENLRVGPDGNLHAIDNGGHFLPQGDELDDLIPYSAVVTEVSKFSYFDDYPLLEDAYSALFIRQTELLREFLEEHSEDIIQHAKIVHGPNARVTQRLRRLLANDIDDIIDQVEAHQQRMLDTRTPSDDSIEQALLDADSLDDFGDGILGDLADEFEDL